MSSLRPEDAGFIGKAPLVLAFSAPVAAPRSAVFAALCAEPSTWSSWFPGFMDGAYEGSDPGVGTKRWVKVGGTVYRETMVAWDEPTTWTYRVDETNVPLARALVEEWALADDPVGGGTMVRWTFACDPRAMFKLVSPLAPMVMGGLFRRAMRNLGRRLG